MEDQFEFVEYYVVLEDAMELAVTDQPVAKLPFELLEIVVGEKIFQQIEILFLFYGLTGVLALGVFVRL